MLVKQHRIVTIYNESGDSKSYAYETYDGTTKIKTLEVTVYDASGEKIHRFKEKDFKDVARADGISIYNDDRIKYLDYAPVKYPYTIEYTSEVEHQMTAFIPRWSPLESHYTSVLKSTYHIINETEIPLSVKEEHLEDYSISKVGDYHYVAENLQAIKPEAYSPAFYTYAPRVKVAMQTFDMKGVKGVNTSWEDFGKWMHQSLLKGTRELPESVITEIKGLTASAETNVEKAKIVYQYLQNKTRYISVQVGIGGWKPMLAKDVDRLSYGDCKGLSNYTKALLDVVGVPSYYAIIYGDKNIRNIDSEFSGTEGNHAVLTIPQGDEFIWLECTSQITPFGYIGNFTDDRDALVITPQGGKIVHTTAYSAEESVLKTTADILLNSSGSIEAQVKVQSYGTQYRGSKGLEESTEKDNVLRFKDLWDNINALVVEDFKFSNNKDLVEFTEDVKVSASNYGSKTGNRILFVSNMFNKLTGIPPRYEDRKQSIEIDRGFLDEDEYIFQLEDGLEVEAMQSPVLLETKFGTYSASMENLGDGRLKYKRQLLFKKGLYPKEDYDAYRDFWIAIAKHDNAKNVLLINNQNQ
ncbi:DUF3857 domain-containing protein [Formosa sp. S-31]